MKILVATGNNGKLVELKALFADLPVELISLNDLPQKLEVLEDGDTFAQNALKKAEEYYKFTNIPTIADDSGICVDALDGFPGIRSARFIGEGKKPEEYNEALLKLLEDKNDRKARYVAALAFIYAPKDRFMCEGTLKGRIDFAPKGSCGFGYDPIFIPDGCENTVAELGLEVKNKISHRAQAMRKLKSFLEEFLSVEKL